ncbi:unnamed protein product [Caenorhabditis nigoni]|uniref:Protein kinase domain-containing protein n=1 Tax=Caenorhabditis nigoni TaxID=1611254 RepID=A0A2G5SNA5_9PELO|nr:hypothetical protein B9Z55_023086 [Caenorhabditis nigoni]
MSQPTETDREEQALLVARDDPERFQFTSDLTDFGSYGTIHSAYDTKTNIDLVIKCQDSSIAFKRELEVLQKLEGDSHFPQIVDYYGVMRSPMDFDYFIAMTIEGESIRSLACRQTTRWSNANCVRLMHQLFEAVEALHNHGYCHRDIHPGNVTIKRESNKNLSVKLIDFGVAEYIDPPLHPTYDWTSWQASLQVCQGMPYTCSDDLTSAVFVLFKVLRINPFGAQEEWKENKEAFHQHPHAWFGEDTMWIAEIYEEIQKQRSRGVDYSGLSRMLGIAVPEINPRSKMEYEMTGDQIFML